MKYQILFSGKNKKQYHQFRLLNYPREFKTAPEVRSTVTFDHGYMYQD